jgi:hypothetical protein
MQHRANTLGTNIMSITRYLAAGVVALAAIASAPAQATTIPDGTAGVLVVPVPAINTAGTPKTFSVSGMTFQNFGTDGFAAVAGGVGFMNGVVSFGNVGDTIAQSLSNFLTFADGFGGNYQFSVSSVKTVAFTSDANGTSGSLYLLGSTLDSFLGLDATATSLTMTFNSTNGSPFTASATLAVPPSGSVPEPATWGMIVVGFGAMGAAMRRRQRTNVTFA